MINQDIKINNKNFNIPKEVHDYIYELDKEKTYYRMIAYCQINKLERLLRIY